MQPVPRRVPGHPAPSPPPHAPATRVQAAAGCAWLRATPWSILPRTRRVRRPLSCTRALQTGCPSRPSFSPLLAPIPKRKVLTSSLRAPRTRVRSAGASPWPRARIAINRRLGGPGAARGARLHRGSLGSVVSAVRGGHAEAGPLLGLSTTRWPRRVLP